MPPALRSIFLYEHVTGGGLWTTSEPAADSLLREGRAMTVALATDLAALPDVDLHVTWDVRQPAPEIPCCNLHRISSKREYRRRWDALLVQCEETLLIAPEPDLWDLARRAEAAPTQLRSASSQVVLIACMKSDTSNRLAEAGVATPRGCKYFGYGVLPSSLEYPVVAKPVNRCGSQGVLLICSNEELRASKGVLTPYAIGKPAFVLIEEYRPGLAASVAFLCGPAGQIALPPCGQNLSDDGTFRYLGGGLPLSSDLAQRATSLAARAVAVLPDPRGYIGVDLVLGEADDGSQDCVIEINPRLTTSYIGLREAARTNLAGAMLAIARGEPADLSFHAEPLEFTADGAIVRPG